VVDIPRAVGVARRHEDAASTVRANRRWWDADADAYHAAHGEFLGDADFVWSPERLREADAHLLGEDLDGKTVLEVGCGAAMCSRWLIGQGAKPVAFDVSSGMLRHARAANGRTGIDVPLVQADAQHLPFAAARFDVAFTAFGALPFVEDSARVMAEVARVLRPGGIFVSVDSVYSRSLRLLHLFDTMVLVDPRTLPERLGQAGFTDVQIDLNPYAFRVLARR